MEASTSSDSRRRQVVVAPPDPLWHERFEQEASILRALLRDQLLSVHHVGSTSVPGLWAKPTVDVMPLVNDVAEVDAVRPALEAAGFEWRGEHGLRGRRYLVRFAPDRVAHATHVHIYAPGHAEAVRSLAFRDHLRAHADLAAAYAALKRELASVHAGERERYQSGKSAFIEDVLRAAMGAAYVGPVAEE